MAWLEEFLWVLANSKKTQLLIWLGVISFVAILVLDLYVASRLNFNTISAPLTNVIRQMIIGRYEIAAWFSLASFLILAAKSYRKDRKRLLGI
jgi:putative Ca2+/H+ antiporter (TMEM165/GDT1 family)